MSKLTKKVRKWHRSLAMLFFIPMILTLVTGVFLVYRKELSFMQPKMKGDSVKLTQFANYDQLEAKISDLGIEAVVSHYRFYPSKGIISARTKDYRDFHFRADSLDLVGEYDRNDSFFIKLHEGSYFGDWSRIFILGPMAFGLLILCISGGGLGFRFYRKRHN